MFSTHSPMYSEFSNLKLCGLVQLLDLGPLMGQARWVRKMAVSLAWQPTSYKIGHVIHPSREAANSQTSRVYSVSEAAAGTVSH